MRTANIARIRSSLSEPEWMVARLINDRGFEGHAYAKNSGGTLSGLNAITPDDLRAFKNAYLTQDRLLIAVAGDITEAQLSPAIDRIFGALPKTAAQDPLPDMTMKNAGDTYLFEADIPQTKIEAMLPALDHRDPDYYALEVMNHIFGGAGFGSRLMEEAREKRGLTYGIYSSLQNMEHADVLTVSVATGNESAGEMVGIIQGEMKKMAETPPSAQELADAKAYITGSMPLSLSSTDAIASIALGLRIRGLPVDYYDHYASRIEAVTQEDVRRLAAKLLDPEKMVVALVGQPKNIDNATIVKELPNVR
jgi:zinc protease